MTLAAGLKQFSLLMIIGNLVAMPSANAMSISEALERASVEDLDYAAAKARYAAERENGVQVRSELKPKVEFGNATNISRTEATYAYGSAQDVYPSWSAYIRARQAIFRFGWSARKDGAKGEDALATENFRDQKVQFAVRVSQRYLNTLVAEDAYEQALGEARAVEESLSDTQKRYEVELVPGVDVKEAQARNDLARAALVQSKSELEDARDALAELTGYDRSPLPKLKDRFSYPSLDPIEPDAWVRLAQKNSAAVRTAKATLNVAKSELEIRRSEILPQADLVLEGTYFDSLEYQSAGQSLGARQEEARATIEIKIPIYAGGSGKSQVRKAAARVAEAEARLAQARKQTERNIRTAFRSVETAKADVLAYDQVLDSARAALTATQSGYDAGTRTITDVLDAKSRVITAIRQRNESRYLVLIRMLQLNAESGILSVEMVKNLDTLFVDPASTAEDKAG